MAGITLDGVSKVYPNGVTAVAETSLEVADAEFMVLVGPSGSGKTTLLRMIAGLEECSTGRILIGDRDVTTLAPEKRDIAMVFQSYALYPNMTVRDNLAFGLRMRGVSKKERVARAAAVAELLGLTPYLQRRPGALSGGQRQRVAMGRAMVREPLVYLMDEPLSNLDAKLRVEMRASLGEMHERLGVTTVYVTHDQVEATTLGHRVAVLNHAELQQCASPATLYDSPANLFVAGFIGSPSMNLVPATVGGGKLRFAGYEVPLPPQAPAGLPPSVVFGFRPTDLHLAGAQTPKDWPRITVNAEVVEEQGADSVVSFRVEGPRIDISGKAVAGAAEQEANLFADDRRARLAARISGRTRVHAGVRVEFAIDANHLYFFDRETGLAIRSPGAGG